jgi:hypothetical protein
VAGLSACQSTTAPGVFAVRAGDPPYQAATRISHAIGRCWFGPGEAAFADYLYTPETDAYAGRPRVLIVPRSNPNGLPLLIVEASEAKGRTQIETYGPLLGGSESARIRADVARWAGGAEGCA